MLGGCGVNEYQLKQFAAILNCSIMSNSFSYLGIPIGENPRKTRMWEIVMNKIRKGLSKWKEKHTFAGRVCLVKSVISALPIFFVSFFKAPKLIVNEITKLQRKFVWGWGAEQNKISWVKWDRICQPKDRGGLDIRDFKKFNEALAKWKWRFATEEKRLWRDVLMSKYGDWRELNTMQKLRYESIWWRDLMSMCGEGNGQNWFDQNITWRLGSGSNIRFWIDRWNN